MSEILVERSGAIAAITLNRPERLNAMNLALMEALRDAIEECALDTTVRAVLLRGSGASFCAGGDVDLATQRRDQSAATDAPGAALIAAERTLRRHAESVTMLYSMPKPVVAALRGHVVGGGVSLALAADLRVASATTKLRVGYLGAGLSGDFGISFLLPQAIGETAAKRLAFLEELVDAAEGLALGLFTEVVADESLDGRAEELASQLAQAPTLALGKLKENMLFARGATLAEAIRNEALNQRLVALTRDAQEAGAAIRAKRPPEFRGE